MDFQQAACFVFLIITESVIQTLNRVQGQLVFQTGNLTPPRDMKKKLLQSFINIHDLWTHIDLDIDMKDEQEVE